MTLMALSLAIGLVIDDAIVVLESIFRKVEHGADAMSAALAGSAEVGLAVVSTTLAVCGVFHLALLVLGILFGAVWAYVLSVRRTVLGRI